MKDDVHRVLIILSNKRALAIPGRTAPTSKRRAPERRLTSQQKPGRSEAQLQERCVGEVVTQGATATVAVAAAAPADAV